MIGNRRMLERRLRLAQAALVWERLWPGLWPAASVLGSFAVLALFDVLPLLPGNVHLAVLIGFGAALVAALAVGLRGFSLPDLDAAARRLERDSGLAHRPLAALDDSLAGGSEDTGTAALWAAHRQRMQASLRRLRVAWPAAGWQYRDPRALRAALLLLLVVGAVAAWGDVGSRFRHALQPPIGARSKTDGPMVDAWVTPPAYTGLAPVVLHPGNKQPVPTIPTGSVLLARVHGGHGAPRLYVDGETFGFTRVDDTNFKIEATLTKGERLAVRQHGHDIAVWPIAVVADAPPGVDFASPPQAGERGRVRVDYEASDDYRVEALILSVRRADTDDDAVLELPIPINRGKIVRGTSFHDLTAHPWAGRPVFLRLTATDGAGQTGSSEEEPLMLPERTFLNATAQAIIAARKALDDDPAREWRRTRDALDAIAAEPTRFQEDIGVFLALRVARLRLVYDRSPGKVASVRDLLWEAALQVEDGGLSQAERDLHETGEELRRALDGGMSERALQERIERMEQALERYLDSLSDALKDRPPMDVPDGAEALRREDLRQFMDRIRELAQTGQMDVARDMLARLRETLEALRLGPPPGVAEDMRQMRKAMDALRDIKRDQQGLLDRTFRQSQRREPPDSDSLGKGIHDQDSLRRYLGDVMRQLGERVGEMPERLGDAELSMRDSARALRKGSLRDSVDAQGQALQSLKEGMDKLTEQMSERVGGGMALPGTGSPPMGRDPLGRGLSGSGNERVNIPEQGELRKANEILDELRRRASEPQRPQIERDYIERLLKRF